MRLLLIALFGLACFVSGVSHALLWYETASHPLRRRFADSPRLWRWLFARGVVSGVVSQMILAYVYAAGFLRRLASPRRQEDQAGPPILLIHGLYHNGSAWLALRRTLRRHGLTNVHAVNVNTFTRGLADAQAKVQAKARELAASRPDRPLMLVGHSLGGLLARSCLLDPTLAPRLGAVVTLGAPHQGSKLAAFGFGPCATDLMPGSAALARLNAESAGRRFGVPCLSLFPLLDNMVLPPDALLLPGSRPPTGRGSLDWAGTEPLPPSLAWPDWRQEEVSPVSHVSLLFHAPTLERTAAFLTSIASGGQGEGLCPSPLKGTRSA